MNTCIITTFFCPVLILCNLVSGASCEKVKRPSAPVWTLHLRSRPRLTQGSKVLFQIWIIWKIGAIILFKTNMAEKDICHTHMLKWTVIFLFVWTFYSVDDSLKVVSAIYIFASLFCMSKIEHLRNKKNAFYLTSKALLILQIIKFEHFRYSNVINCPSMKHETHYWITWEVNTVW